jgi:hypothetical protein
MSAAHAKAHTASPNLATAAPARVNAIVAPPGAGSNRPKDRAPQAEKAKPRASRSNTKIEAGKSFPHRVSPGAFDRESFNNRYHCGFAQ